MLAQAQGTHPRPPPEFTLLMVDLMSSASASLLARCSGFLIRDGEGANGPPLSLPPRRCKGPTKFQSQKVCGILSRSCTPFYTRKIIAAQLFAGQALRCERSRLRLGNF